MKNKNNDILELEIKENLCNEEVIKPEKNKYEFKKNKKAENSLDNISDEIYENNNDDIVIMNNSQNEDNINISSNDFS